MLKKNIVICLMMMSHLMIGSAVPVRLTRAEELRRGKTEENLASLKGSSISKAKQTPKVAKVAKVAKPNIDQVSDIPTNVGRQIPENKISEQEKSELKAFIAQHVNEKDFQDNQETRDFIDSVIADSKEPLIIPETEKAELEKFIDDIVNPEKQTLNPEEQKEILKFVEEELSLKNLLQIYEELKEENEREPIEDYQEKIQALSRLIVKAKKNLYEKNIQEELQNQQKLIHQELQNRQKLIRQEQQEFVQKQKEFVQNQEQRLRTNLEQKNEVENQEFLRQAQNLKTLHKYIQQHQNQQLDDDLVQKQAESWNKLYGSRRRNQSWGEWLQEKANWLRGQKPQPEFVDLDTMD